MSPDSDDQLRRVYLEFGIPIDQYARRPEDLDRFVAHWNPLSGRADSPEDILHYMRTKRKKHKWVTFDGNHHRLAALPEDILTPEGWAHLGSVYEAECIAHELGSDNIDHDEALAEKVSRGFAALTGRLFPGRYLLAILMVKRKRGNLAKVYSDNSRKGRDPVIGFGDIDEIVS
jgi:hypothetical protein